MSNCDWGRPCTCTDCRSDHVTHACTACGFPIALVILREYAGIEYDRKSPVETILWRMPELVPRPLACPRCATVDQVAYSKVNDAANEHALGRERALAAGRACSQCARVEGFDRCEGPFFAPAKLANLAGEHLCQSCHAARLLANCPDPSSPTEKYRFDARKLEWVIEKVKLACGDCGRPRWLNAENAWQRYCSKCYKARIPA